MHGYDRTPKHCVGSGRGIFWKKWEAQAKVEDLTALLQSLQRSNNGGDHSSPSLSQKQSSLDGESNVSPFGSIPGGSTKI